MLRPRLRIPQVSALLRRTQLFTRSEHTVPILDQFKEANVPGLLSPAGYATAWTEYMENVTDRLNYMTAGTDYEPQTPLTILRSAARDPMQAAIFNYASMAHNNHFFFRQLVNLQQLYEQRSQRPAEDGTGEMGATDNVFAPEETQLESSEQRIPPKLRAELEKNFSSIETLRIEFLTTAMAMFGPGFVWLVKNATSSELRILTTYLAGSPYTAAHWRRQSVDMNTLAGDRGTTSGYIERMQTGAGNTNLRFNSQAPGGTDVIPLLCLNTWEHVWLTDYGIKGKANYVQQWWETIDWNKVEALAQPKPVGFLA